MHVVCPYIARFNNLYLLPPREPPELPQEPTYVLQARAFDNGDDEEAQEDVPQVEGQLATYVGAEIAISAVLVFITRPYAEGLLFVHVGLTHGNGDGKDRNVHHDQVRDLNGGMQVRETDDGKACSTSGGSLEEAIQETETSGQAFDSWGVELEARISGHSNWIRAYSHPRR